MIRFPGTPLKVLSCFLFISAAAVSIQAQWVQKQPPTSSSAYRGVFAIDQNYTIIVGAGGTILRTSNGGETWALATTPGTQNELFSIQFLSPTVAWAAGTNTVIKTEDGGDTWTEIPGSSTYRFNTICFPDGGNGYAIGQQAIWKTINGGATWQNISTGTAHMLLTGYFLNGSKGWTAGTSGAVLSTTNGGSGWGAYTSGQDDYWTSVHFADENNGMAVGGSSLLRTTDGGASWSKSALAITANDVYMLSAQTACIVGDGGKILITGNGGDTWQEDVSTTTNALYAVHFSYNGIGYAVGGGGVILRTEGIASIMPGAAAYQTFSFSIAGQNAIHKKNIQDARHLEITDLSGRLVHSSPLIGLGYTWSGTTVSGAPAAPGAYIIRLLGETGSVSFKTEIR